MAAGEWTRAGASLLRAAAGAGDTSRQQALSRLDDFYRCREYDHLEWSWEGLKADQVETISPGSIVVPQGMIQPMEGLSTRQRRPVAPSRLAKMIVSRFTDLLFSEGRIPKVVVTGDEEAHDFVSAVFAASQFWRSMIQARNYGGSMGSSLVVVVLERGRFAYSAISPRCVREVAWRDWDRKVPSAVLIQYDYEVERTEVDGDGRPVVRVDRMTYRRIVDEQVDVVFEPTRSEPGRDAPVLVEQRRIEHRLGRFPGAWIQNLPVEAAEFDGEPDCDGAFQLIEAVDRLNSQSYRGLNYNQDPTLAFGRDRKLEQLQVPLRKGSENALNLGVGGFANYLEISGAGITVSMSFVASLKQNALDLCQCVLADPASISGAAQSAKAIEYLYAPMLSKAGRMRTQYGEAIAELARVTLELARIYSSPAPYSEEPGNVVGGVFALEPRTTPTGELVERTPGITGTISLSWGPYFDQTNTDRQAKVSSWSTARGAYLSPLEDAARGVAEALGVQGVEEYVARVLEETEKREERERALAQDLAGGDLGAVEVGEAATAEEAESMGAKLLESATGEVAATAQAQAVALNGAQVQAASDIVARVAARDLPKTAGIEMLVGFFGLPRETVEAIFRGIE